MEKLAFRIAVQNFAVVGRVEDRIVQSPWTAVADPAEVGYLKGSPDRP
jgi:hypothetical protein